MKYMPNVGRSATVRRAALATLASVGLAGCGGVSLVATTNIPTPLLAKLPATIALHVPKEFAGYVHKEERWSTDWNVDLGKAQSDGIVRLMNAMFEHVVVVESVNAGSQLGADVRAIFEPSVEEYAFVTPRDAGSPFFAVSIKYRVNIYSPDGRLADSWGFTGYGTSPASGLSSSVPLAQATALAIRDAGAKLAVEFREQAIVRGLMPDLDAPDAPAAEPTPAAAPAVPTQAPGEAPVAVPAPMDAPAAPEAPAEEKSPPAPESEPAVQPIPPSLALHLIRSRARAVA